MKLWYSKTSPYARKALVVIAYHGLKDIELLETPMAFDAKNPHNQDNPLGRVPALQMLNDEWLFGSYSISEYLDNLGTKQTLFPKGENRWSVLALHALADGILENAMPVVAERLMRHRSEWWLSRQEQLSERCLRSFKDLEKRLIAFADDLNIGTITVVCLVEWWILRQSVLDLSLTDDFPDLVAWTQKMKKLYPILAESWEF
ncbi:glutathione S-transferase family protein [Streptococcus oricebi]|uniref:Glutathione S-transferase n=1 Tax=Streptococcus oricebi TaxID=1547447 RepID=A0ABS5B714_9STRE|nr:glutathione S-transferase family protein [Streptococcus oricebi]MBP2623794.1 glutathione S-transferase [Streptococcus oricebi]